MIRRTAKLFQRQLYSLLSSKCALASTIAAFFIIVISLLQFGEVSEFFCISRAFFFTEAPSLLAGPMPCSLPILSRTFVLCVGLYRARLYDSRQRTWPGVFMSL